MAFASSFGPWAVLAALLLVGGTSLSGCHDAASDCALLATCAAAGGAGQGGSAQGGSDGGCEPGAAPSEGGCVDAEHGIFVRPNGDDDAEGTREAPVQTFAQAATLALEQDKVIYACAETFSASAQTLPPGVTVYGGLDCDDWSWAPDSRTTITTEATASETPIPLTLLPPAEEGQVRLFDLEIVAPDAMLAGDSSVAVLVDDADAHFVRCVLRAGRGADGADGEDAPTMAAPGGVSGNDGAAGGCFTTPQNVPPGPEVTNPICPTSVGGEGGEAGVGGVEAGAGADGEPSMSGSGQGAPGEEYVPPLGWTCGNQDGADGEDGAPGLGGSDDGWITDEGYLGDPGEDGEPGAVGQGGGGGGGTDADSCSTTHNYGNSGGSGGSGGCGGAFGAGGGAGGSSIALLSIYSELSFEDTELEAGQGGAGGAGGDGQPGGFGAGGGLGGGGATDCSQGGNGGDGGAGGPGGGGHGGHSVALLHAGVAPDVEGATLVTGSDGAGGPGGSGAPASSEGSSGVAKQVLELQKQ